MLRARRVTVLVAAGAVLGSVLTGCSKDAGPAPDPTARALATALTSGKLAGLRLTDTPRATAQRQLSEATKGLGGLHPEVKVTSVRRSADDDKKATATLRQSWTFPGTSAVWRYTTRADLVEDKDRWSVRWRLPLVVPGLTAAQRLTLTRIAPARGDITGAGGRPLVTNRPVVRVGIDKARTPQADIEASARSLATLVGVDRTTYGTRVANAGPRAFVEAIVLRASDAPSATALSRIPGALAVAADLPLAPTRDFARPILGTVGPATAELVQSSKGRLRTGDVTGLSGLQRRYDEQLRGRSGVVVRMVSATPASAGATTAARELFRSPAVDGRSLSTTLDERLQKLAESTLASTRPASAIVAVRPSDGHVLAAASGPGSKGLSTATVGRFAPGSTFKVVTSLALLRAGLRPSSTVTCSKNVTVDGRVFKNYSDYPANRIGRIPLEVAVANSCNTAMIGERDVADQQALADAAAGLGLGVDHDLGYPVFLGSVPAKAGSATEHAASMIGQAKVEASPVAMAAVAASVAKGATVTPLLVDPAPEAPSQPDTAVRPGEAKQLHALMRAVVTQGSGRFLASLAGPPVAAKTGTAEFGTDTPPKTHTWMIAIRGDLAVAVFVDVGQSGSRTAGPLLERFLRGSG